MDLYVQVHVRRHLPSAVPWISEDRLLTPLCVDSSCFHFHLQRRYSLATKGAVNIHVRSNVTWGLTSTEITYGLLDLATVLAFVFLLPAALLIAYCHNTAKPQEHQGYIKLLLCAAA